MKQIGKNVSGKPHLLGGMGCGMTMFTSRKSEPRQPPCTGNQRRNKGRAIKGHVI